MIDLVAHNWQDLWKKLHEQFDYRIVETVDNRFASRAVSFDNKMYVASNELGNLSHKLVCYTDIKLKLFQERYIIPGKLEEVIAKLKERADAGKPLTVMSYPFNIDNKAHDQGPCILNIVITMFKKAGKWNTSYRVNLRTGEITRRFVVDLVHFQKIIAEIEEALQYLNPIFHGVNLYASVLYAQPSAMLVAKALFANDDYPLRLDTSHWFHQAILKQEQKYAEGGIKHKMTRRIGKHVQRIKDEQAK